MGTTPKLALPYPEATDPADVPLDMQELAVAVEAVVAAPVVSSLPASPQDGQIVSYLADAAKGVVWRLRYRAAAPGSYKWEFVGGSPLYSEVLASQTTTSLTYVDLATVGPDLTLALAGDYMIGHGAIMSSTGGDYLHMSYAVGAVAATDTDQAIGSVAVNLETLTQTRTRLKTAIPAATLIRSKYRIHFAGRTGSFEGRWLMATPVRVG